LSIPGEISKVATSAIDALKGNPLCLSLVVLIAVIMGINAFQNAKEMAGRSQAITALIERCMEPAKR
jgi:hypothetical protein